MQCNGTSPSIAHPKDFPLKLHVCSISKFPKDPWILLPRDPCPLLPTTDWSLASFIIYAELLRSCGQDQIQLLGHFGE
ncbi:hypothetical protein SCLCIDRAFT_1210927 [Scleroderma citrinum Foug A]|uniref:Uncharacterized protein n=1 Tax=Scleroderma citrinum Foug A TaxID=1036808 RepID=A0A0C3API3_9AGAM|nr:hypothetical protein SCLCIDRAFT_1210927 [Scleroderma citrinum Foug A]